MKNVELTKYESRFLTWLGKQRYANACERDRDPGLGPSADGGDAWHIRGCHAEYAASIGLNLYWRPHIGLTKQIDVGGLIEVRSIDQEWKSLIVKPDARDVPFVLVHNFAELSYRLLGWRFASDVKRGYRLRLDRGDPAHFCPSRELDGIETLLDWIKNR
jgi:hypothetical protein